MFRQIPESISPRFPLRNCSVKLLQKRKQRSNFQALEEWLDTFGHWHFESVCRWILSQTRGHGHHRVNVFFDWLFKLWTLNTVKYAGTGRIVLQALALNLTKLTWNRLKLKQFKQFQTCPMIKVWCWRSWLKQRSSSGYYSPQLKSFAFSALILCGPLLHERKD